MSDDNPGVFVLQRRADGKWFDAETFETEEKAFTRLRLRIWEERHRINCNGGSGYTMEHPQQMRVVQVLAARGEVS